MFRFASATVSSFARNSWPSVRLFCTAFVGLSVFQRHVVELWHSDGPSMRPTLNGDPVDILLVDRWTPAFKFSVGDVVIAESVNNPGARVTKRIIGKV